MIFLLIAGTGTAAFLLTAPKLYAAVGLSVLCGLTLAAIVTHLVWMNAPEKLVGAIFIGLEHRRHEGRQTHTARQLCASA